VFRGKVNSHKLPDDSAWARRSSALPMPWPMWATRTNSWVTDSGVLAMNPTSSVPDQASRTRFCGRICVRK